MRLDKLLANSGFGSRSEVKEMIRKGRVLVNNVPATKPEINVAGTDEVRVGGRIIGGELKPSYYMLNKPAGLLSATEDKSGQTVIDLFAAEKISQLFPVGRLDKDTEGLLLVTDDGELAHYLLAPSREIPKVYYAQINGLIEDEATEAFRKGFSFKDFDSKPAELKILSRDTSNNKTEAEITVTEGKFHEVKRLVAKVGGEVTYLRRIAFGSLKLDESLKPGSYRRLTDEELQLLKADCKNH